MLCCFKSSRTSDTADVSANNNVRPPRVSSGEIQRISAAAFDQVNKRAERNWNDRPCPLSVNGNNTYRLERVTHPCGRSCSARDTEKNTIKITRQTVTILDTFSRWVHRRLHLVTHASLTLLNGDSFTNSRKRCETVARPAVELKSDRRKGTFPYRVSLDGGQTRDP